MRRRTADFLQGELITKPSDFSLTNRLSPAPSQARERGEGKEDSEWQDIQGPGFLNNSALDGCQHRIGLSLVYEAMWWCPVCPTQREIKIARAIGATSNETFPIRNVSRLAFVNSGVKNAS